MSTNLFAASNQWAARPADERFQSLETMHASAKADRDSNVQTTIPVAALQAVHNGAAVLIQHRDKQQPTRLTHWAFSQLARIAGAPADYMRTLPADLAAQCVNVGLDRLSAERKRDSHALLLRNGGPADAPYQVRAITSERYSRVWDERIVRGLIQQQQRDPRWQLPKSWRKDNDGNHVREGAYRGERDSFVIMTNGGSILEDASLMRAWSAGNTQGNGQMFRGFMLRNSEVGASSVTVETFLFRMICGNHIIWNAEDVRKTSRRHIGRNVNMNAEDMIAAAMRDAERSAQGDEQTIAKLAETPYAATVDDVIERMRKDGLTESDAKASYTAAAENEPTPRSVWGVVNGITRHSQTHQNQDDRFDLDQLAGAILKRARIAVAA